MRLTSQQYRLPLIVLSWFLLSGSIHPVRVYATPKEDSLAAMFTRYLNVAHSGGAPDAAESILPADLGMAKRIALDALAEIETHDIDAFELLQPYFEKSHNFKDLRLIDSITFFNALCEFIDEAVPEFSSGQLELQCDLLGIVDDTPDSKYMVYRCHSDEFNSVQVMITVYERNRWFVSLEGSWVALRAAIIGSYSLQRMRDRR